MDHLSSISLLALRPLFNLATQYPTSVRTMGIANTHTLTSSSSSVSCGRLVRSKCEAAERRQGGAGREGDGGRWRWFGWFPEHRGHRERDAGGGARDLDVQAHVRRAKTEGVDVFDAMEA